MQEPLAETFIITSALKSKIIINPLVKFIAAMCNGSLTYPFVMSGPQMRSGEAVVVVWFGVVWCSVVRCGAAGGFEICSQKWDLIFNRSALSQNKSDVSLFRSSDL